MALQLLYLIAKEEKFMKYNGQRGYSLVEILITIAILIILAAIAIPSFQGYVINTNLKSAGRDLSADFFNCKERAVAESRMYRITFNVGANYIIEQCNNTGSPCNGYTTIATKTPATFNANIQITNAAFGNGSSITFQTRGTATPGSVTLTNSRGSTAIVRTNITGKPSVQFNIQ
jgi:prepilin-type N-terminal cleavage/methylation domain-containing protein